MIPRKCFNRKATVIAAALITLLLSPAPKAARSEEPADEQGNCAFSRQLQDEGPRIGFVQSLREARESSTSRFGQTFRNTVQMRLKDGDIVDIDTFSVDCLSCHDGINARGHDLRMKNSKHTGGIDMTSVLGSHPIGMDYGSYAYANEGFKHISMLRPGMDLIDGKVGCLTCHSPLNPKKNHLVEDNDRSSLCFACHKR